MILVVGGLGAGKRKFIREELGYAPEQLSSVPEVSPPEDSSWASSPPPQAARLRTMTMAIMRAKNFFFIL